MKRILRFWESGNLCTRPDGSTYHRLWQRKNLDGVVVAELEFELFWQASILHKNSKYCKIYKTIEQAKKFTDADLESLGYVLAENSDLFGMI